MIRRLLALGALVVALVVVAAAPASAHATLLTTDPQNGGVYDKPPSQVKLRFNEPVEVSLGGVRLFSSDRERVVTGSPEHPGGTQSEVAVSLPQLDDGTYVVTWRVISADSHPVEGAFTFAAFRRMGAMADGMAQLLRIAAAEGATSALTYVAIDNVPSLRGCANVGFDLDHVRVSIRRLGRRRSFTHDPDADASLAWGNTTAH